MTLRSTVRDYIQLTKPGITVFNVLMAWGGMVLAPAPFTKQLVLATLIGTALSVGAANTFNMYIERESDKFMRRTKNRPLAAGRMEPTDALIFGIVLALLSTYLLLRYVNVISAVLSVTAILIYSLIYTPMKKKSPAALPVGAIPGAMPPLMGWTAVTGQIDKAGLVLFAILLLWQIPHSLAISLYSREDHARAGIKTVPAVLGEDIAKIQAAGYSLVLLLTSLLLVPLGVAGILYLVIAVLLGAWFAFECVRGFRARSTDKWARGVFRVSLIYLPALTLGLMLDIIL